MVSDTDKLLSCLGYAVRRARKTQAPAQVEWLIMTAMSLLTGAEGFTQHLPAYSAGQRVKIQLDELLFPQVVTDTGDQGLQPRNIETFQHETHAAFSEMPCSNDDPTRDVRESSSQEESEGEVFAAEDDNSLTTGAASEADITAVVSDSEAREDEASLVRRFSRQAADAEEAVRGLQMVLTDLRATVRLLSPGRERARLIRISLCIRQEIRDRGGRPV